MSAAPGGIARRHLAKRRCGTYIPLVPSLADRVHNFVDGRMRDPRRAAPGLARQRCAVCESEQDVYAVFGASPLLHHCPACGTESLLPTPTPAELSAYYNDYRTTLYAAPEVRELTALAQDGLLYSLRSVGLAPSTLRGARFFEVGFGCGSSLFASAALGARVTGIDPDPAAVARARAHADAHGYDVTLHVGRLESYAFQGEPFDFVRASHVLEHTVDPRVFLLTLRSMLRPGGVLLLECPNNQALLWLFKNAMRKVAGRETYYNALKMTEHLWGFNREGLQRLLEGQGFEVRAITDYSVADHRYQPDVARWYPTLGRAVRDGVHQRSLIPLGYACVRVLDIVSCRVARGGTGLAAVAFVP
jgi:2-polyprenyl-3-methyl-5-hydroxy-6-metoxy-1,4-benzoquinol methylase